jgi:hypothetical protein
MTRTIAGRSRSSDELLYGTQSACQSSGLGLLISCYALGHDEHSVSGKRKQTPQGQLDIWVPVSTLAMVGETSDEEVKKTLEKLPVHTKESIDWIIRLKSEADADAVVSVLSQFFSEDPTVTKSSTAV